MKWNRISNIDQLLQTLSLSDQKPIVIFKHSTRCPISASMLSKFETDLVKNPNNDFEYCFVDVIENRDVSLEVARLLNVQHESPQAIVVKSNKALKSLSHYSISYQQLTS